LDGPESGNTVAGYAVSISADKDSVIAGWLVAKANVIPNPYLLSYVEITDGDAVFSIAPTNFGVLGPPLSINSNMAIFSCDNRICAVKIMIQKTYLISAVQKNPWATTNMKNSKYTSFVTLNQANLLSIIRMSL